MSYGKHKVEHILQKTPSLSTDANGNTVLVGADGSAVFNDAGLRGASPSATAAINTSAIQAALDAGGVVTITTPGTYSISGALVIGSDTELILGPNVEIKQASASNTNLLVSEAYSNWATTYPVTLSWTAGVDLSVAWVGHGRVVDDYIVLSGASPSHVNGIYRVSAVIDANTVTVSLDRTVTSAPTGTVVARIANKNITVRGGVWNYNNTQNDGASAQERIAIILGGVANLSVDTQVKDVEKFGFCTGAVRHAEIRVMSYDTDSDVVKIYGPARDVDAEANGIGSDDLISCQTKEPDAYVDYRWTYGDLYGIRIVASGENRSAASMAALYLSPGEYADAIRISVRGSASYNVDSGCIKIQGDTTVNAATQGFAGTVTVEDCSSGAKYFLHVNYATVAKLTILPSCSYKSTAGYANLPVLLDTYAAIQQFDSSLTLDDTSWPSSAQSVYQLSGTIDHAIVRSAVRGAGTGRGALITAGSAVRKLDFIGYSQDTGDNCLVIASSVTNNPVVSFIGCDLKTTAVANVSSSCVLIFAGNRFESATNGVVRTGSTPTVEVRSDGTNKLVSGSWVLVPSGTPVLTLYGYDIAVDPIALTGLATTSGQYCLSTQATPDGGPCVKTGAGWVALGTGASGVNTVIT